VLKNRYAWKATNPKDLMDVIESMAGLYDPIGGKLNAPAALRKDLDCCEIVLAAWGKWGLEDKKSSCDLSEGHSTALAATKTHTAPSAHLAIFNAT
jgi:hypothetical protein